MARYYSGLGASTLITACFVAHFAIPCASQLRGQGPWTERSSSLMRSLEKNHVYIDVERYTSRRQRRTTNAVPPIELVLDKSCNALSPSEYRGVEHAASYINQRFDGDTLTVSLFCTPVPEDQPDLLGTATLLSMTEGNITLTENGKKGSFLSTLHELLHVVSFEDTLLPSGIIRIRDFSAEINNGHWVQKDSLETDIMLPVLTKDTTISTETMLSVEASIRPWTAYSCNKNHPCHNLGHCVGEHKDSPGICVQTVHVSTYERKTQSIFTVIYRLTSLAFIAIASWLRAYHGVRNMSR